MSLIQGLILAGGIGKRMWPLNSDKNLIKFIGKPIIEYTIDDILKSGIKNIVIVTNPANNKKIKEIAKEKPVKIKTIVQSSPKGMAHAILTAAPLIKKNPLLIINSSDLLESNVYKEFVQKIKGQKIVLGGLEVSSYLHGGYFKLKGDKIVAVVEKPGPENIPSNLFKLVIDYFSEPGVLLSSLSKISSKKDEVYEVALSKLIKNEDVGIVKIKSFYQLIKHPWDVLGMMEKVFKHRIKNKINPKSQISSKATIEKPVVLGNGVKVFEGAIIKGPAYIGKDTIIGNNVLVRNSMIGENCVVGYNTEVTRSWVGDNSWLHCNYIGDSVIEGANNFGSGARLANLRLDEKKIFVRRDGEKIATDRTKLGAIIGKGVKVGVNSSIMPGVLIGENSFIGPGQVIKRNIPDNSKII